MSFTSDLVIGKEEHKTQNTKISMINRRVTRIYCYSILELVEILKIDSAKSQSRIQAGAIDQGRCSGISLVAFIYDRLPRAPTFPQI